MENTLVKRMQTTVGNPLRPLGRALPQARPFINWVELRLRRAGELAEDESGQSVLSVKMIATGLLTALTLLVIGVIIWPAIENLAVDVAGDIEAAGSWSP